MLLSFGPLPLPMLFPDVMAATEQARNIRVYQHSGVSRSNSGTTVIADVHIQRDNIVRYVY